MDLIRSAKNHTHLVEEIRKRAVNLNKRNWKIEFKWVKAQSVFKVTKSQIDSRRRQLKTTK